MSFELLKYGTAFLTPPLFHPRINAMKPVLSRPPLLLALIVFCLFIPSAGAVIIYSGLVGQSVTGVPNSDQKITINITGDLGSSVDDFTLSVFMNGATVIGSNFAGATSQVALVRPSGADPFVTRFSFGDPFPISPISGSGTLTLWNTQPSSEGGNFVDTLGYAAMISPTLRGWVLLDVQHHDRATAPFPRITVVDYAYTTSQTEAISMGQRFSVPDYPTVLTLMVELAATVVLALFCRRSERACHSSA